MATEGVKMYDLKKKQGEKSIEKQILMSLEFLKLFSN